MPCGSTRVGAFWLIDFSSAVHSKDLTFKVNNVDTKSYQFMSHSRLMLKNKQKVLRPSRFSN